MDTSVLILAVILGCIPGAIAQKKGYNFVTWWIFGTLLFIVALPASLIIKPLDPEQVQAHESKPWYTKL